MHVHLKEDNKNPHGWPVGILVFKTIMYQIVNKTKNTTTNMSVWPSELLEQLLNEGNDIIVISFDANKIHVPYKVEYKGSVDWYWRGYKFSPIS